MEINQLKNYALFERAFIKFFIPIVKPMTETRVIPNVTNVPKKPDNNLSFNISTINGRHKRLKIIKTTNNVMLELMIFFMMIPV